MNLIKDTVSEALKELFELYKERGIISIYMYGSITGPDFNIENSDIDTIALVDSSTSLDLEKELNRYLVENFPSIPRFGIRILYRRELENVKKEGSVLTSFIPPEALVLDFSSWQYVIGIKFTSDQFTTVSYAKGLQAMYDVLKVWNWLDIENVKDEKIGNYLKVIARILWVQDGLHGHEYNFSYSRLAQRDDENKRMTDLIVLIKKDGWSSVQFLPNKVLFQTFVEKLNLD